MEIFCLSGKGHVGRGAAQKREKGKKKGKKRKRHNVHHRMHFVLLIEKKKTVRDGPLIVRTECRMSGSGSRDGDCINETDNDVWMNEAINEKINLMTGS